ncbi:MAG: regulatory protein GemA [Deltaproteobacteria bacterium]|nr:regulatory protein GemA [Deltaproteobacteria bacterium]
MRMIEPIQIRLIHIAKTQLGLSEDEYRQAIGAQTHAKKWSSKDLTYFEADGLINYFKTLGFRIQSSYIKTSGEARRARWQYPNAVRAARNNSGNVVTMPSRDQMDMIDVLRKKIAWRFEDGYDRWLTKYMKIKRVATAAQASNVIEGLKGLLQRQPQEAREA